MKSMENMEFYNRFKAVPTEAKKTIQAGRLKGYTDINPMWRLKILTEVFGPVGIGWYYEVKRLWTEPGGKEEVAAFAEINLFFKHNGEWSRPIPGIGGNTLVANERNGLYTNDECYKMAITDALSVACKSLGVGADVYYEKDRSKYDTRPEQPTNRNNNTQANPQQGKDSNTNSPQNTVPEKPLSEAQCKRYYVIAKNAGLDKKDADGLVQVRFRKKDVAKLTKMEYDSICTALETKAENTLEWYRKQLEKQKTA